MKKIAIVTDSNSGITQAEASSLGIDVLPMPFFIDGEEYFEDINLSHSEFYKRLEQGAEIRTSQPAVADVLDRWDQLLKENDEIVYIPMSSGLSGSYETAFMLANNYDGRVQVVNNQRISVTQRQSVIDSLEMASQGKSAEQIKDILEEQKFLSSIYITVDTLKYLQKGGRVTSAAAAIGTVLNIKPVLQIQGEKLDAFAKCRGMKLARRTMLSAIKNDMLTRFASAYNQKHMHIQIAHTNNSALAEEFKAQAEEEFPGYSIYIAPLSLSVACHIGSGSLAIACTQFSEY